MTSKIGFGTGRSSHSGIISGDRCIFYLQYSGADQGFATSFAGVRALGPVKPEVGRWYHLVDVRDTVKDEPRLYVDGQLAGTARACLPQAAPTGNTVIGRGKYGGNPVDYLDGTVGNVHLYDGPCPRRRSRSCATRAPDRAGGPVRRAAGSGGVPDRCG